MDLFVDDAGFVRAPAPLVYRRLTDVAHWPTWWAGSVVSSAGSPVPGEEAWNLELRAGRLQRLRLAASFHGWRLDTGVRIRLRGDVEGDAEFWLEPSGGGTVVHHLFVGRTPSQASRRVHDGYRRAIRQGLWGCKDAVQLEVRTMGGARP